MIFTPFEPKVAFRYTLNIDGIPGFLCKASGMPKIDNGEIIIDYINTDFKVKGKSRWQDISVTLYDPVTPSGAQAVMAWLRSKHEPLTGIDGWPTSYMKKMEIELLGPDGSSQQKWTLFNAWVQNAEYGDLDMADESTPVQINLTLRYDKAVLQY